MKTDHLDCIAQYDAQLPNLAENFAVVSSLQPGARLKWAKDQLKSVFRDGWFVNTPVGRNGDGESVDAHILHLIKLIDLYFPAKHKNLAKAYAGCHDDQEAIAHAVIEGTKRDLNPRFNKKSYQISDKDKETIETCAVDLLFEGEQERRKLWQSYKECSNETSILFSGLDKICVMWPCVEFVESGKYDYNDFQAYWDYWTPENARKKLPEFISNFYIGDLYPKAEKLRLG